MQNQDATISITTTSRENSMIMEESIAESVLK